jgi:hypothetical protein
VLKQQVLYPPCHTRSIAEKKRGIYAVSLVRVQVTKQTDIVNDKRPSCFIKSIITP